MRYYLYDRGWKQDEVDALPFGEALIIDHNLNSGLYGPIRDLNNIYRTMSYQHASLGIKEPLAPFYKVFSAELECFMGEKYVPQRNDLFEQALLFAESANAITPRHKELLEEIRNGNTDDHI